MQPDRNAPCPCGSGKKAKHCCGRRSRGRGPVERLADTLIAESPRGVLQGSTLDLGLTALGIRIENDPLARPTLLLCKADGFVCHAEVLARPPAEPERLARLLADAVRQLCARLGERPARVRARHAEIVAPLAASLADEGLSVELAEQLPEIDRAVASFQASSGGAEVAHAPAAPETWAAWQLPEPTIAALFAAGAATYRAAPWRTLWDRHGLSIETRRGGRWTVIAIGAMGESFGIVLCADPEDYRAMRSGRLEQLLGGQLRDSMVSFNYELERELPKRMQREIRKAGWEVAGPKAWPHVMAFNTPGGALTPAIATDLLDLLRALPRFMQTVGPAVLAHERSGRVLDWNDPETGLTLRYDPALAYGAPIFRNDVDPPPRACLMQGPAAEPAAALDLDRDRDRLRNREIEYAMRFEVHLEDLGRSDATVDRHVGNAVWLIEFMAIDRGIPLRAMSEFDLRCFLFDWYPRKADASRSEALALPASLRQFFRYLDEQEGLQAPWATRILMDEREAFARRWEDCPGVFWFSEGVQEWRAQGMLDLELRGLTHDGQLTDDVIFGQPMEDTELLDMGVEESRVEELLGRHWPIWHDEILAAGVTEREVLIEALHDRRRVWADTAQPALDGRTPRQVLRSARG